MLCCLSGLCATHRAFFSSNRKGPPQKRKRLNACPPRHMFASAKRHGNISRAKAKKTTKQKNPPQKRKRLNACPPRHMFASAKRHGNMGRAGAGGGGRGGGN